MGQRRRRRRSLPCRFLLLSILVLFVALQVCEGNRRVSIPDELDDVIDEEEDEEWKEWGKPKNRPDDKFDPPPTDFSKMGFPEIQAEMIKRHIGPSFGFVKLRPGVRRSRDDVPEMAMRWTKLLRTGSVEVKFMAVDVNTIMFTLEKGQRTEQLKDFILGQPEAYEIKIGDYIYRRPGDPPLGELVEKLRGETGGGARGNAVEEPRYSKQEL